MYYLFLPLLEIPLMFNVLNIVLFYIKRPILREQWLACPACQVAVEALDREICHIK